MSHNKSCIQIAENPGRHHGRTKHIDVKVRHIEQAIQKGKLALVYVKTAFMVADILTKALSYERHARHAAAMKGQPMPLKAKAGARKRKQAESEWTGDMED